jgi:hypothetical protein
MRRQFVAVMLLSCVAIVTSGCVARQRIIRNFPDYGYAKQAGTELHDAEWLTKYHQFVAADHTDAEKQAYRNRIIDQYIAVINAEFHGYEATLYNTRAGMNVAGDLASLGLTSAAGLTGTADTKALLAVIATGTSGAKSSIEKNFFDEQSRDALVTKMQALRDTKLASIEDSELKTVDVYTLEKAMIDLQEYFHSGTLIAALQKINQESGAQSQKAESARAAVAEKK